MIWTKNLFLLIIVLSCDQTQGMSAAHFANLTTSKTQAISFSRKLIIVVFKYKLATSYLAGMPLQQGTLLVILIYVSLLAVQSMYYPGLFQDQFPDVSVLTCFSPTSLRPIFFRSFSASSNNLFLVFPTGLFPSGVFLNVFFTVLSSDFLSTCHNHLKLLFLRFSICRKRTVTLRGPVLHHTVSWIIT